MFKGENVNVRCLTTWSVCQLRAEEYETRQFLQQSMADSSLFG